MPKQNSMTVEHLVKRLQEDNAELIRQRDALQQRVVGLMQQSVMNCAMGLYVREPSMSVERCFADAYGFTKYAETFLVNMPEVKEQFQATDADKPADNTAH